MLYVVSDVTDFLQSFLSYGVGFGGAAKDFVPLPQDRKDNIYRGGCVMMSLLFFC